MALETFARMVAAHGGDTRVAETPEAILPKADAILDVPAPRSGFVASVDAAEIGRIVLQLGGGRQAVTDRIDYAVGVDRLVQRGEKVSKGDPLLRLHARSKAEAQAFLARAAAAFSFSSSAPAARPLIYR